MISDATAISNPVVLAKFFSAGPCPIVT